MCSDFSLRPVQASKTGPFKKIFDSFTRYLLTQGVTYYRNLSLISIHIIIQFSLMVSFSNYIRLRQFYEFPFILRDLRHIYQCVVLRLCEQSLRQELMIARCKFIECVIRKSVRKRQYVETNVVFISLS